MAHSYILRDEGNELRKAGAEFETVEEGVDLLTQHLLDLQIHSSRMYMISKEYSESVGIGEMGDPVAGEVDTEEAIRSFMQSMIIN